MKHLTSILFLAFVSGCGSGGFTTAMEESDAAPGGATSVSTGGSPETGTGGSGSFSGTGGTRVATGGAPTNTGGVHVVGTGGVSSSTGGTTSTGGLSGTSGAPTVDACALVTHDNGLGQTWTDCVPLGTYNQTQAMKACAAWCATNSCIEPCGLTASGPCNDPLNKASVSTGQLFLGWVWQGPNTGGVTEVSTTTGMCTTTGTWH